MKLLRQTLDDISAEKRKTPALMTHVVLGYPTLAESIAVVKTMADSGASIIELQIPFSDPMADGPTIMQANQCALENGVTPKDCMKAMEKLAKAVDVPLLFMTYFQIPFCFSGGLAGFCSSAKNSGAEGLIVPDISVDDQHDHFWSIAAEHELATVPIAAPTSSDARLEQIAKRAEGAFVYCVSTTGTTGAREKLPANLSLYLERARKHCRARLALGFGISKPEHIRAIGRKAEIAVVGSATINLMRETKKNKRQQAVARFVKQLLKAKS